MRKGDWKMVKRPNAPAELYDLGRDPGEQRDLAGQEAHIVDELDTLWRDWRAEQPEPLFVPDPEQWEAWRRKKQGKA